MRQFEYKSDVIPGITYKICEDDPAPGKLGFRPFTITAKHMRKVGFGNFFVSATKKVLVLKGCFIDLSSFEKEEKDIPSEYKGATDLAFSLKPGPYLSPFFDVHTEPFFYVSSVGVDSSYSDHLGLIKDVFHSLDSIYEGLSDLDISYVLFMDDLLDEVLPHPLHRIIGARHVGKGCLYNTIFPFNEEH